MTSFIQFQDSWSTLLSFLVKGREYALSKKIKKEKNLLLWYDKLPFPQVGNGFWLVATVWAW